MSDPRKHHIIPAPYLAGFTSDKGKRAGTRRGKLCVADLKKSEIRSSTPNNEGYQRDFYRLEVKKGSDPNIIEKNFSKLENEFIAIQKRIIETNQIPSNEEEFNTLINWVAFLWAKGDNIRKPYLQFNEDVLTMMLEGEIEENPKSKKYKFSLDVPPSLHTLAIPELIDVILPYLALRRWVLWRAEDGDEYITSDNPVMLSWFDPSDPPPRYGFGNPETMVSVPLNKRVLLVGLFDDTLFPEIIKSQTTGNQITSVMNHERYRGAISRLYYSDEDKISFLKEDGTKCSLEEILKEKR